MENHRSSQVFPPVKTVLSSHYTFEGICMAAFREKGGVEERNRDFRTVLEELQLHFRELPRGQSPSACLQFISPEIRNFLTGQHRPANDCNVYSAGTVISNLIKRGGDEPMG